MIVVNPETSIKDAFGLFEKVSRVAPSVPFVLTSGKNPTFSLHMSHFARQNAIQVIANIDKPIRYQH